MLLQWIVEVLAAMALIVFGMAIIAWLVERWEAR
jgi:hypothetical protein